MAASSSSSSSSKSNIPKRKTTRKKMAAQPAAAAKSNTPKRREMAAPAAAKNTKKPRITKKAATCSCLPDELWEKIFKSLNCNHQFLSVVSKQFLSITNGLRSSLTITDETIPYLPRLFHRYPNLTSVDLTRLSQARDLGAILTQISTFSLDLRSLSCNSFAANGFLALSKTMKNLTSFSFTPLFPSTPRMGNIKKNDFLFILHCFPLLDNLNLSFYPDEPSDQILKFELFRSRIDGRFSWKYEVL